MDLQRDQNHLKSKKSISINFSSFITESSLGNDTDSSQSSMSLEVSQAEDMLENLQVDYPSFKKVYNVIIEKYPTWKLKARSYKQKPGY